MKRKPFLREATAKDWGAVISKHQEEGTCPSCGVEVDAFATMFTPSGEAHFCCPNCSVEAFLNYAITKPE